MHAGYEVDASLCRRGTTNDSSVGAAESRGGKLPSADVRCGWANFPSSRIVSRAAGWPDSRHHESSHRPRAGLTHVVTNPLTRPRAGLTYAIMNRHTAHACPP